MKGTFGAILRRPLLLFAVVSTTMMFVPIATSLSTSAATTTTSMPASLVCNIVPSASVRIDSRSYPCVVTTHVGASFSIRFNAGQRWSDPRISPPSLLVTKISLSSDGPTTVTLRAISVGTSTVTSTGRPICAKGVACPMYVILWNLDVIVSAHRTSRTFDVNGSSAGQHLTLHRGDLLRVQLAASTMYTWTEPTSSKPLLVRRLSGAPGAAASALFVAAAGGRVMVSAVSNPTCYPRCLPPSRVFEVTITVVD